MDLKLSALIGATYLIPIAITLRRVYAPSFDMPEAFALAVARIDAKTLRVPTDARQLSLALNEDEMA